ncbi:MAG TPA: 4'-phosphopantetheinyl transferase superfamily protein [Polyangia bacterium]|nr:4'-phosphopantetheinyl transferase superfamily protein [Polyangia bacterium]
MNSASRLNCKPEATAHHRAVCRRSLAAHREDAIPAPAADLAILAPILLGPRAVVAALPTPIVEGSREKLFPDGAVLVTSRDLGDDLDLFPEEFQAMARATSARRFEFSLGRRCAREALAILGGPRVAIPVGRFRDPVWPFGYVGSITHCRGFCAAAAARTLPGDGSGAIRGLGLDSEPAVSLPEELAGVVCTADECAWLASRQGDGVPWDRLFFCAKESAYKCLFPATHRFLEFRDVGVRFDPEHGGFDARLPSLYGSPSHLLGRYAIRDGIILAATTWMEGPECP